jgi:amidase
MRWLGNRNYARVGGLARARLDPLFVDDQIGWSMSTQPDATATTDELWRWSATALTSAIRAGHVSSVEAVTACLERVDQVNPALNALVDVPRGRALAAAAEADRAVASGAPLGVLHGVPVSIKDNVDEAGLPNSGGLVTAAHAIAAEDAPVVKNLRAAGAISIGRSNVPAFSLRWFSDNDLYGRTLNPWSPIKTPGGSSGGAAAAVASGMVPLAHGNDIGGSVRYPAHVCGLMGMRPTVGRIPAWVRPTDQLPGLAPSPLLMSVEGVLARTTADIELGLRAMAIPDLRDPACVPAMFTRDDALDRGATLGLFRGGDGTVADAPHQAALDQAAAWLCEAGFAVEEIEVPQFAEAHRLWMLLLFEDLRGDLPQIRALGGDAINRSLELDFEAQHALWGTPDLEAYINGHIRRTALIAEMEDLLSRFPVIVLPAAGAEPPDHDADLEPSTASALLASQWPNSVVPLLGLPGLTVPTGVRHGLPTGVQLLAGRFRESRLLDVAQVIEAAGVQLTPIDPVWHPERSGSTTIDV